MTTESPHQDHHKEHHDKRHEWKSRRIVIFGEHQVPAVVSFLLKNFKVIKSGRQAAYIVIGIEILLVLASAVMIYNKFFQP